MLSWWRSRSGKGLHAEGACICTEQGEELGQGVGFNNQISIPEQELLWNYTNLFLKMEPQDPSTFHCPPHTASWRNLTGVLVGTNASQTPADQGTAVRPRALFLHPSLHRCTSPCAHQKGPPASFPDGKGAPCWGGKPLRFLSDRNEKECSQDWGISLGKSGGFWFFVLNKTEGREKEQRQHWKGFLKRN